MYQMRVDVELTGPPSVITRMMSNDWNELSTEVTVRKKTIGESIGRVTDRKRQSAPAPSTLAASYKSRGMLCSPARKMTVAKPSVFQFETMMTAGIAHWGSRNQFGESSPTQPSIDLIMPKRGSNI